MNRRLAVDVAACVLLLVQFLLGTAQATGTMSGPPWRGRGRLVAAGETEVLSTAGCPAAVVTAITMDSSLPTGAQIER
jgi:hypothetical protein